MLRNYLETMLRILTKLTKHNVGLKEKYKYINISVVKHQEAVKVFTKSTFDHKPRKKNQMKNLFTDMKKYLLSDKELHIKPK